MLGHEIQWCSGVVGFLILKLFYYEVEVQTFCYDS
jgi:hypothetical protein